jgi:hypothetical protein
MALIGLAAKKDEGEFFAKLIGSPKALAVSFVLMFIAGMAGGVIASGCTKCKTLKGC